MANKHLTKRIKETLMYLGEPYVIRTIDLEEVIYTEFKNRINIEISGLNLPNKPNFNCHIYVWSPYRQVIEQIDNVKSKESLKDYLNYLTNKYENMKDIPIL